MAGTASVCAFLRANQPWATSIADGNFVLHELTPGEAFELPGCEALSVRPVAVPHRFVL